MNHAPPVVSNLAVLASFLSTVGFVGNLLVPKSIRQGRARQVLWRWPLLASIMGSPAFRGSAEHGELAMLDMRRFGTLALVLAAGFLPWLAGTSARAQWGGGFGGYGWGLGYQTPASVSYLNQRSLAAGNAAYASRPQAVHEPTRPPRDVEFFNRYDAATLQSMEDGVARHHEVYRAMTTPPTATTAATAPPVPVRPVLPLASFFNKARKLIWPADAPTEGDLSSKRSISDTATIGVLNEVTGQGYAQLSSAIEARNKLLDYGRPALKYMRDRATPRVADTFHLFLLALYDSIGQSTERPKAPATTR
jgi:hypothetical protein